MPFRAQYDPARLDALVATSATDRVDLRPRLDADGVLDWTPPPGRWRVHALSSTPSIKVKRAAPGGEGWMLDPFSVAAMRAFLAPFTAAFDAHPAARPRAMYHDSFEYGADWSRVLLDAFARRRGYRLEDELVAFVDGVPEDRAARVKHDYRQTLDELLVDEAFPAWIAWTHRRGMIARNEAHGAPANLLDFYALADVPETEMFRADRDTRVSRVAASAAHVEGRRLVSAETGTWIAEHFHETLAGLKDLVDQLFVAGVNHVFYHGAAYSPDEAAWPGWLFYASTQMNARNAIWHDVPALNAYIARVQAALQSGAPDNDVLVYWPIHDLWHDARGTALPLTIHAPGWLDDQPIGDAAPPSRRARPHLRLHLRPAARTRDRRRRAGQGAGRHVCPAWSFRVRTGMPVETATRLLALARSGATVVFEHALPDDVPGLAQLEARRAGPASRLRRGALRPGDDRGPRCSAASGWAACSSGHLDRAASGVPRERFGESGLEFIRRRSPSGLRTYFVANRSPGARCVGGSRSRTPRRRSS